MSDSPLSKRAKLSSDSGEPERKAIEGKSQSPIEQLPRELIWKIIEYAPQTVNNMRLSCSSLRNRVSEYAREPLIIPLVEKLIIFVPVSLPSPIPYRKKAKVTIKTSLNKTSLFQWRFNALSERLNYDPKIFRGTKTREGKTWRYFHFDLIMKRENQLWIEIVMEWLGRRIKELEVAKSINYEELATARKFLKNITIDHLSFFADTLGDDAFNFLKKCSADHLLLNVIKIGTSAGSVDVLRELSSTYRSMHIFQRYIYEDIVQIVNRNARYFFGLFNHNWAPVIVDMFSRKLNMLRIENDEYPQYWSSTEEDTLIEQLTTIGKPVWFQTSTSSRDRTFEREINEHWVKRRANLLTFTHRSLKNEIFRMIDSPQAKRAKLSSDTGEPEMKTIEKSHSPIEQLPRELIWKIIEFAPQAVNNMRLSCDSLRNRVSEYAREPLIIPLVEKLIIFVPPSVSTHASLVYRKKANITIISSQDNMALFQWRFNALKLRLNYVPKIERVTRTREGKTWRYFHFDLIAKRDVLLWLDIVSEWIGGKIKEVEVAKSVNDEALAAASHLLKEISIDHLSLFVDTLRDAARNFLKTASADHLFLNLSKVETTVESVSVLSDLASVYRSMHIFQRWKMTDLVQNGQFIPGQTADTYFFGVSDHDWAPAIVDMFSRKLNMLRIENESYPLYWSNTKEDTLIDRLTTIGKPVWFQTNSANRQRIFENELNEHWIKSRPNVLTISHGSLKDGPNYFRPR